MTIIIFTASKEPSKDHIDAASCSSPPITELPWRYRSEIQYSSSAYPINVSKPSVSHIDCLL